MHDEKTPLRLWVLFILLCLVCFIFTLLNFMVMLPALLSGALEIR